MMNDLFMEFEMMCDYNMYMKIWFFGLILMVLFVGCVDMAGEVVIDVVGVINEVIMNNQEEGVDEGGIVKNIGDYLMVLCKGCFFVVDVLGVFCQSDSVCVVFDEDLNE